MLSQLILSINDAKQITGACRAKAKAQNVIAIVDGGAT